MPTSFFNTLLFKHFYHIPCFVLSRFSHYVHYYSCFLYVSIILSFSLSVCLPIQAKKGRNGLILQKNTTLDHITNCKHLRLPATAFLGKKEKLTGKFSLCIVLKCMVDIFVGIFIIASEYSKLFTTKRRKKWTLTVTVLSFTL